MTKSRGIRKKHNIGDIIIRPDGTQWKVGEDRKWIYIKKQKGYFKKDQPKLFDSLLVGFIFLKGKTNILILGLTTILSDVAIWGSLSVLTITISKEIFDKGTWGYGT